MLDTYRDSITRGRGLAAIRWAAVSRLDAKRFIGLGTVLIVMSACTAPVPDGYALIRTAPRSKIVMLDGEETSKQRVSLAPGHHKLRFETETKLLLFSPECEVTLNLKEGTSYRFSSELEETPLRTDALGVRWRQLKATGVLSVPDPAEGTRRIPLPCVGCIAFSSGGAREQAVGCQRYRADLRIEESCRVRDVPDLQQCVRDSMAVIMNFRRTPDVRVIYIPGPNADYSKDGHRKTFEECTKDGKAEVEACLARHGWEPVL